MPNWLRLLNDFHIDYYVLLHAISSTSHLWRRSIVSSKRVYIHSRTQTNLDRAGELFRLIVLRFVFCCAQRETTRNGDQSIDRSCNFTFQWIWLKEIPEPWWSVAEINRNYVQCRNHHKTHCLAYNGGEYIGRVVCGFPCVSVCCLLLLSSDC